MFDLFKRKSRSYNGPDGKRLYAIGDVHGCFDELMVLMELIKADNQKRTAKDVSVVFLGDLIDRGPKSKAVLDYLQNDWPDFASLNCLMGNHEEMFLSVLDNKETLIPRWMKYGGRSCVESYGVNPDDFAGHDPSVAQIIIKDYIPSSHIKFVKGFQSHFIFGDYFLVHAGVDPKQPLEGQSGEVFYWIREPFLSWNKPLQYRVVHGHTIEEDLRLHPHRIGVDSGAYQSGVLSAVRLEDDKVDLLNSNGVTSALNLS